MKAIESFMKELHVQKPHVITLPVKNTREIYNNFTYPKMRAEKENLCYFESHLLISQVIAIAIHILKSQ